MHLDEGFVDILQSKAHRDRRLYLSDELINYFKEYDNAIKRCFPEREYFFPGGAGGICSLPQYQQTLEIFGYQQD